MKKKGQLMAGMGLLVCVLVFIFLRYHHLALEIRSQTDRLLLRQSAIRGALLRVEADAAASISPRGRDGSQTEHTTPAAKASPRLGDALVYLKNPGLIKLSKRAQRGLAITRYGPFFQKAGLSTELLEKFADMLAEGQARRIDCEVAAEEENLDDNSPALQSLLQKATSETRAEQVALLGAAGDAALREYERSRNARTSAIGLYETMASTDPMSAEQVDQLTAALANASTEYRSGAAVYLPDVDFKQVDQAAQNFLTPAQLTAFQRSSYGVNGGGRAGNEANRIFEAALAADKVRH